jgi:hypothetical protein
MGYSGREEPLEKAPDDLTESGGVFVCKFSSVVDLQALWLTSELFTMSDILTRSDRLSHIRNELLQLFNQQTEFFRKGGRAKQTQAAIAEYETRRERIRRLFAELDELRKVA